jgi:hypothetical protein
MPFRLVLKMKNKDQQNEATFTEQNNPSNPVKPAEHPGGIETQRRWQKKE